jgi:hypothetical protein
MTMAMTATIQRGGLMAMTTAIQRGGLNRLGRPKKNAMPQPDVKNQFHIDDWLIIGMMYLEGVKSFKQ